MCSLISISLEENYSLDLFKTDILFVLLSVKENPGHYYRFEPSSTCDFGNGHYVPLTFTSLPE